MRFFDFFKKGEEPLPKYTDDILGELIWDDAKESWIGDYNGFNFSLAYDKKEKPNCELIVYTREILRNSNWLNQTFMHAKADWLLKNPNDKEEVKRLVFAHIHFNRYKNISRIFADISGASAERSWRIEYSENKCEGIGFDT